MESYCMVHICLSSQYYFDTDEELLFTTEPIIEDDPLMEAEPPTEAEPLIADALFDIDCDTLIDFMDSSVLFVNWSL